MLITRLRLSTPPPSINAIWRAVNGRVIKSKAYRDWLAMAGLELMSQRSSLPEFCYWRADILIPASKTKCDIDNVGSKAIFDALGAANLTPDDRYLVDYRVRFHAGDNVEIALQQEDLQLWAKIKGASKALIKKLS